MFEGETITRGARKLIAALLSCLLVFGALALPAHAALGQQACPGKAVSLQAASAKSKAKAKAGSAKALKKGTYRISYTLNGGAFGKAVVRTYKRGVRVPVLPTPVREGYSFIGWYADAHFRKLVTKIPKTARGNKRLYARWVRRSLVAHRGYHASGRVENSLGAYAAAAKRGFKYVETDVRFTQDDKPVLSHDESIRVFWKGLDGKRYGDAFKIDIAAYTLDEIEEFFVARYRRGSLVEEPEVDVETGELAVKSRRRNLARFGEFLDLCKEEGLEPSIELKEGTKSQLRKLVRAVDARGMTYKVRWVSKSAERLKCIWRIHPRSKFAYVKDEVGKYAIKFVQKLSSKGGKAALHVDASLLIGSEVNMCRKRGIVLGVWTLDDEREVSRYSRYVSTFAVDSLKAGRVPELI